MEQLEEEMMDAALRASAEDAAARARRDSDPVGFDEMMRIALKKSLGQAQPKVSQYQAKVTQPQGHSGTTKAQSGAASTQDQSAPTQGQ